MGIKGARVYSNALKQGIVRRLEGGERVAAVAEGAGIDPKLLYDWWALYRRMGIAGLSCRRGRRAVWNGGAAPAGLPSDDPSPSGSGPPPSPPTGSRKPRRALPNSSAWSASSRWICIFFAKPCGSGTRPAPTAARPPLRGHPSNDRRGAARLSPRRRQRRTAVPIGRRFARRLLSAFRTDRARADEADLRDKIQRIALENRFYGYRRVCPRALAHPWA